MGISIKINETLNEAENYKLTQFQYDFMYSWNYHHDFGVTQVGVNNCHSISKFKKIREEKGSSLKRCPLV